MSLRRGLTTWVLQAGTVTLGYRCNMRLRQAVRTFTVMRGKRIAVACGPLLVEW
jgi:hypothetical protein